MNGPRAAQATIHETVHAVGAGAAFGTFGELLQGALPGTGLDFLVTLPIARWSRATFLLDPNSTTIVVRPGDKWKVARLAEILLRTHEIACGGVLLLDTDLPEGKGMASSSADLIAAMRAIGHAIGVEFAPTQMELLLRQIEPSDGVMYPGVVAFYHREVRLHLDLGHLPPMTIVGIDEGGGVETLAFNRAEKKFTTAQQRTYERLLVSLSAAIARADVAAIGEIATQSARMNQRLCPKHRLHEMLALSRRLGGAGVVTAHSGTVLGVLFEGREEHDERVGAAARACARLAPTVWVERTLPYAGDIAPASYLPSRAATPQGAPCGTTR